MKVVFSRMLCVSALVVAVASLNGQTAQSPGSPASNDPRVSLKAGLKDAGVAASNMELVVNLPKPPGFFEPKEPAGSPTEAEKPEPKPDPNKPAAEKPEAEKPATDKPAAEKPAAPRGSGLNFANSDLAFRGNHLFTGNFSGFNVYDISNPARTQLIA